MNRVFPLTLELVLEFGVFQEPLAIIVLGSDHIVIPNVNLDGIFITERYRFV